MDVISSDSAQFMFALYRMRNGLKLVICFRHSTPSHYHHYADLFISIEHPQTSPSMQNYRCVIAGINRLSSIAYMYVCIYVYIYIYIYIYIYQSIINLTFARHSHESAIFLRSLRYDVVNFLQNPHKNTP